jgi:hypothetical protein
MGFTVARPGGTKDTEFEVYARLLRQRGKDLGKLPRVPDPGNKKLWLHVWPTRGEAEDFARVLRQRTRDDEWKVRQVNTPPSAGPLGPLLLQVSRRAGGLIFAVHPLSHDMLRSAFPEPRIEVGPITVDADNWYRQQEDRDLSDLVLELANILTRLKPDQLRELGFVVIDDRSGEVVTFEQPVSVARA